MASVLVELLWGEHCVSIPPTVDGMGEGVIKYKAGDTFEIPESGLEAIKDKVKVVKKTRKTKMEDEEGLDEESDPSLLADLVIDPSKEEVEDRLPISRMNITIPTIRILKMAGYQFVDELRDVTEEQLLRIQGLGEQRVKAILEDVKAALG